MRSINTPLSLINQTQMSKYNEGEIEQLVNLCRDLLVMNEELNTKVIAMDAMCRNSDSRSKMWERRYFHTLSELNACREAIDIITPN
jgi:hypothetical protein